MFYLFIFSNAISPFAGKNIFPRDLIQVLHCELGGPESELKDLRGNKETFEDFKKVACCAKCINLTEGVTELRELQMAKAV